KFEEGRDYRLAPDGKGLVLPAESRIPRLKDLQRFLRAGKEPDRIPHRTGDPQQFLLFDNQHRFHDLQIEVTYEHSEESWKGKVAGFAPELLPKTIGKLRNRTPVTIAVSGDSISAGYNASGFTKAPPGT